jgi:hypothetical protein
MIGHLWARSGDPTRQWVYVTVPHGSAVAIVADGTAAGGIRAHPVLEGDAVATALAVLLVRGPDTFAITRGRINGRPPAGGMAQLAHQDALTVGLPSAEAGEPGETVTLYACSDGLVETFEYEPPADQSVPALCAVCGLPLKAAEKVRRACPGPGPRCSTLLHAECAGARCPACDQEIADPTGRSTIWMPGA